MILKSTMRSTLKELTTKTTYKSWKNQEQKRNALMTGIRSFTKLQELSMKRQKKCFWNRGNWRRKPIVRNNIYWLTDTVSQRTFWRGRRISMRVWWKRWRQRLQYWRKPEVNDMNCCIEFSIIAYNQIKIVLTSRKDSFYERIGSTTSKIGDSNEDSPINLSNFLFTMFNSFDLAFSSSFFPIDFSNSAICYFSMKVPLSSLVNKLI